jgi:hypothetical protein
MLQRHIEVSFQKEGVHKYPAALTDPKLKEVEFLGYPHRHMFHFHVKLEVFHNDREVEFILFKRELEKFYETRMNLDFKSCEMLAEELILLLQTRYPNRDITTRVYEDGENGAVLEYSKPLQPEAVLWGSV